MFDRLGRPATLLAGLSVATALLTACVTGGPDDSAAGAAPMGATAAATAPAAATMPTVIVVEDATWNAAPPARRSTDLPAEDRWSPPETEPEEQWSPQETEPEVRAIPTTVPEVRAIPTTVPEARPTPTPTQVETFEAEEHEDEISSGDLVAEGVTIDGDAAFDLGSAELTSRGRQALERIAQDARRLPAGTTLEVHGHVDELGDPAFNDRLAAARARTAAEYLRSQLVTAGLTIVEIGHGEDDLLHPECRGDCPRNRVVRVLSV